jgi:hypothetical protein
LVEALVGIKARQGEEVVGILRQLVTEEQLDMISHSLHFLAEDNALRLPGEPFLHADFAGAGAVPVVE